MYRKALLGVICCSIGSFVCAGWIEDDPRIILRRGDANGDYAVNISDPAFICDYLFNGGREPPCMNQADANDDGHVDNSDSAYLYNWLFMGGPEPPPPGPYNETCTLDTEGYISCDTPPCKLDSSSS